MRRLLAYARPHTGALLVGTFLALLAGAAGLVQPLVAKRVIDTLSGGGSLVGPVVGLAALVVAAALLTAANSAVLGRTAERVVRDVRQQLTRRMVRLRIDELDHSSPGDLVSRITADSSLLRSAATTALVDLVDGSLRFVGALILMGWLDLRLLGVSMTVLVGVGVTVGVVVPRIRTALRAAQDAVSAIARQLYRTLGAARTVKASGTEAQEIARVDEAVQEAYTAGVRSVRLNALLTAVTGLSIQVPFLAVLGVGGALVASGSLPVSTLVAFLLYLFYLIQPIGQLVGGVSTLQQGLAAVDRIQAVDAMSVEEVPFIVVPPPAPTPAPPKPAPAGALGVRFEGVRFTYPGRDEVLARRHLRGARAGADRRGRPLGCREDHPVLAAHAVLRARRRPDRDRRDGRRGAPPARPAPAHRLRRAGRPGAGGHVRGEPGVRGAVRDARGRRGRARADAARRARRPVARRSGNPRRHPRRPALRR